MKKDCASVRKSLRKYLRGHLFKYEQVRIARHLNVCPLCRSEFQTLQKMADTKQLLRDITPPEGIGPRMKASAAGLARLKVLIYRPLWVILLLGAFTILYVNLLAPHRDVEIENIEKSLPAAAPLASAPVVTSQQTAASPVPVTVPAAAQAPAPDPLVISLIARDEGAVSQMNEIMRGHGELRKARFSDTVREVSGSLTEKELRTLIDRMGQAGKVNYNSRKLRSFPAAEAVPFVIKMKRAQKIAEPTSLPGAAPADAAPSETAANAGSSDHEENKPEQARPGQ